MTIYTKKNNVLNNITPRKDKKKMSAAWKSNTWRGQARSRCR